MKNKKLRYILVPAVVLIWGLVIYKFFSFTDDTPNFNFEASSKDIVDESIATIDTFNLIADYRDPFLGRQSAFRAYVPSQTSTDDYNTEAKTNSNAHNNKPNNTKAVPDKKIKWPQINYGGLVINQQSAKKVGIMQINGKKYLIEENQSYDNIQVLTLTDDSVQISYFNNLKTFHK